MTVYASELTDFSDLLRATAQWKNIGAAIIEKDYYLTRALCALAAKHRGQFVLKGGTSLSKGWNLLRRFSEDIDLLLRPYVDAGKEARHTRLKKYANTVEATDGFIATKVENSQTGVHRAVSFTYRSMTSDAPLSLSKAVLLEAGYRGNSDAASSRRVRSMVTEFAESRGQAGLAEDLTPFELDVQDVTRTFVEKLYAVHGAYLSNQAQGKTRHYYDLYAMSKCDEVKEFIGTLDYYGCIEEVRELCHDSFPTQPLPDENSFQSSPALYPEGEGLRELARNWKAEQDLYFGQQPPLADVLRTLGKLLPKL